MSTVSLGQFPLVGKPANACLVSNVMRTTEAAVEFGRSRVRHRIAAGIWQYPCAGVVVLHNGPLSWQDRIDVALASARPGSALWGPTALTVDGMEGFTAPEIHLVLPTGSRLPRCPGLIVHESCELTDADVHPARTPRRTRAARSVVDWASWQTNPRRARAIVIAAIQQGLVNTRSLREALTRRGPCRHRGLIIEAVLDAASGIQSLPERDFSEIWTATRLPRITRQKRVRGPNGSFFLDAFCAEIGFGVEVHGAPHLAVEQWDRDLDRSNTINATGVPLLFFSSHTVRHAKRHVADQLLAMARRHGWDGPTNLPSLRLLEPPKRRQFSHRVRRT